MVDFQGKSVPAIRMRAPHRNAPARQAAPRRETVDADGYDERPEPPPRREAPARHDDLNDDIPF